MDSRQRPIISRSLWTITPTAVEASSGVVTAIGGLSLDRATVSRFDREPRQFVHATADRNTATAGIIEIAGSIASAIAERCQMEAAMTSLRKLVAIAAPAGPTYRRRAWAAHRPLVAVAMAAAEIPSARKSNPEERNAVPYA